MAMNPANSPCSPANPFAKGPRDARYVGNIMQHRVTPVTRREGTSAPCLSLLAVALSGLAITLDGMSTTPVRQYHFRVGVALNGALFVVALAFLGISIGLVKLAKAGENPTGVLVATNAFVVATCAFCVWTAAAVIYQARSEKRPPTGRSVVWAPPLVMRVAIVVIAASLGIITAAFASLGLMIEVLLVLGVVCLAMVLIASRFLVLRLEANPSGITGTGLWRTVRIPWSAVRSIEPRGSSTLAQRVYLITEQGRRPRLWMADPRFPINRDSARLLVAELETVRRSAPKPGA
jgi:hypothetical protein